MEASELFEQRVLPCLDAGYNLARWLLRDPAAAEDALQEAALRALRHLDGLRGDDARPWFLRIVRNTCYAWLASQQGRPEHNGWEDEDIEQLQLAAGLSGDDPARTLDQGRLRMRLDAAIRSLSPALREVLVLRELEGLDYGEIAAIAAIPLGTVMSRLARARERLRERLADLAVDAGPPNRS